MAEPAEAGEDVAATDAFFGARLRLRQPARGHRAGTDALLLAAAAPLEFEDLALDVGAGVGAAGLAFAALRPKARIGLIEIDPATAALARENLALNGMAERGDVFEADALVPMRRRAAGLVDARAGLVISNPPFLDPRRTRASPDPDRRRAHVAPAAQDDGASQAPYEAWLARLDRRVPGAGAAWRNADPHPSAGGARRDARRARGRAPGRRRFCLFTRGRTRRRPAFCCAQKRAAARRCRSRRGWSCTRTRASPPPPRRSIAARRSSPGRLYAGDESANMRERMRVMRRVTVIMGSFDAGS